jgi:hypothetical protein
MKAVVPSMAMYMAKLDGRYATEAWNIPVLVVMMIKNINAILGFRTLVMAEYILVSQRAHTTANTTLRR